jgi:hypothetical protein
MVSRILVNCTLVGVLALTSVIALAGEMIVAVGSEVDGQLPNIKNVIVLPDRLSLPNKSHYVPLLADLLGSRFPGATYCLDCDIDNLPKGYDAIVSLAMNVSHKTSSSTETLYGSRATAIDCSGSGSSIRCQETQSSREPIGTMPVSYTFTGWTVRIGFMRVGEDNVLRMPYSIFADMVADNEKGMCTNQQAFEFIINRLVRTAQPGRLHEERFEISPKRAGCRGKKWYER